MQKNIFKKITSLIFLTTFLFGLFVPLSQTFAAGLNIFAEPGTVEFNKPSKITVKVINQDIKDKHESATIGFYSDPVVEGFDKTAKCIAKPENDWSCWVSFSSSAKDKDTYMISAFYADNLNYGEINSEKIRVEVCGQSEIKNNQGFCVAAPTPPTCTEKQILNDKKDACIDPPVTLPSGNNGTPTTVDTNTTYTPLAPLPGLGNATCKDKDGKDVACIETSPECTFDDKGNIVPGSCTNPCPFGNYLNIMIKLIIGIAGVLAMVMIVMGGIEYMTSDLISSKEAGKEQITHAVLGLLLALGAYMILNTINPALLSACLDKLPQATISLGGESTQPFVSIASTPTGKEALKNTFGISCDGVGGKSAVESIGKQFINKTTYSKERRNTYNSSTIYVDCSSFAAQVYVCAGLPKPGNISTDIFSGGNTKQVDGTTFDFSTLHSGDLIGWKPGENKETDGHVMIYLGNGQMLDTQHTNNPTQVRPLSDALKKRIKYVKWP